jgi:hypothetical protein
MRSALLRFVALLVFLLPVSAAHASFKFGTDEDIHFIQDVTLKGANQEPLYLGYMTRTKYFIAGMYVEDVGYVLGVKGQSKRYYDMPKGEDLARFQRAGYLPNPIPGHSLGFLDYVVGYSLWWALALVAAMTGFSFYRKRKDAAAAAASEEAPASADAAPPDAAPVASASVAAPPAVTPQA